jgi:hypothetical protein
MTGPWRRAVQAKTRTSTELLHAHVVVQEVAERPQRFRRDVACGRLGSGSTRQLCRQKRH